MTELDLLDLARAATGNELSLFTSVITINFAMVVAIYYFLHQARLAMKIFAFAAYLIGLLLFWSEMLIEANMKVAAMTALQALPHISPVSARYIALDATWLGGVVHVTFNGALWMLCLGIFYLLFFWKRQPETGRVGF
jgi:hypothetical protein